MKKKHKTKLLILVKHIDGGTGTFIKTMRRLSLFNIDIEIAVLGKEKFRSATNLSVNYYDISNHYPDYYKLSLTHIYETVKEIVWLKHLIQNSKPDVVLSIDTHCNLLLSVTKTLFYRNLKTIITFHNNISAVSKKKLSPAMKNILMLLGHILFGNNNYLVGISKGVCNDVVRFFRLKMPIQTIMYGINLHETNKLSSHQLTKKEENIFKSPGKKIISVGRFEKQKDFITLINAFALVKKQKDNCLLILVGDGRDKAKLMRLINQKRIKNNVRFLGWKNNVFPYLKHSDIFVLSSFYEGFAWVILEAMSQGLPIISTNCNFGPREILANGKYGLLVPIKNKVVMAKTINKLINNDKLLNYYSHQSLTRVKYFSEEKMLNNYRQMIKPSNN